MKNNSDIPCSIKSFIDMGKIKPSINSKGYRTSLKEYDENSVIEEIAANSYDAYATTALFLLDEVN